MLRRIHRAMRLPGLLVTAVLLCLAMMLPTVTSAAQIDEATPIPGDTAQPAPGNDLSTNSDDPDLHAADAAISFDENLYTVAPGNSVTIYMTGVSSTGGGYYYNLILPNPLPDGVTTSNLSHDGESQYCDAYVESGLIVLKFGNPGPEYTCHLQISFHTTVQTPITDIALSLKQTIGDYVADEATVSVVAPPPTYAFDQPTYNGKPGDTIAGSYIVTAPATGGSVTTSLLTPISRLALTYVSAEASNANVTTCSGVQDRFFINVTVDATGAGTCTVHFTITVAPDLYEVNDPAMTVHDMLETAAQIIVTPATITAAFDQAEYSGLPGVSVPVSLTITMDAATVDNPYALYNPYPGMATYANPTMSGTSGVDCGTPTVVGNNIQGTFDSAGGTGVIESCTLSFTMQVQATPDTQQGFEFDFDAYVAGVAPGPVAHFTIPAPAAATGAFDQAGYGAMPGATDTASLTITFPDLTFGGPVIIYNFDPTVMTFSDAVVTGEDGGVTCSIDPDDGSGDIHVSTRAIDGAGSCTITFDISANADAAAGASGGIVAGLPDGVQLDPVLFVVGNPLQLVASITYPVNAGGSVIGDLRGYTFGGTPPYSYTVVTEPTQGTLTLKEDGTFTYTANLDATGTDSFTFMVTDAAGAEVTSAESLSGVVTLEIDAAAPTATATPGATATAPGEATATAPGEATATEKPIIPGRNLTPTATATSSAGSTGGSGSGGAVSQLPSTGTPTSTGGSGIALWMVLAMSVLLLSGAVMIGRRRRS